MGEAVGEAMVDGMAEHHEPATIDWRRHVQVDPTVLAGKPVVRGTRLGVEFLLRLMAAGWTEQKILDQYPNLTPEALRAVFALAADVLGEETWSLLPPRER